MVIYQYYNISNSQRVQSKLKYSMILEFDGWSGEKLDRIPNLGNNATSSEIGDLILGNIFYLISFLSFLLICVSLVSVVLIIPNLPSLRYLYNISLKMVCSRTERENTLETAKVLNRFNLTR